MHHPHFWWSNMTFDTNNILHINDVDKTIYRIFRIDRLKQLMCSNELVLVNPNKLDDPFENFFLRASAIDREGTICSLEELQNAWYVQCWTFKKESDAMWRIYSPCKDGVRVSTTTRKLFSSIWNEKDPYRRLRYFIGKVRYHSRIEIESFMQVNTFWNIAIGGQNHSFAKLLCIKREEFSHEDEVRVMFNDVEHNLGEEGLYRQQFEYDKVFDSICLDPRLDEDEFEQLKHEFQCMGCTLPITQSELYRVNFDPISLM